MTWQIFDNARWLLFVTISTIFILEQLSRSKYVPVTRIQHELRKQSRLNMLA